jgi:hypothetical protein
VIYEKNLSTITHEIRTDACGYSTYFEMILKGVLQELISCVLYISTDVTAVEIQIYIFLIALFLVLDVDFQHHVRTRDIGSNSEARRQVVPCLTLTHFCRSNKPTQRRQTRLWYSPQLPLYNPFRSITPKPRKPIPSSIPTYPPSFSSK